MAIHILNCGSMRPCFPPVKSGVTCLLVETNQGPVLVDTGFGLGDYLHPSRRMRFFLVAMRSKGNIAETAIHQVQRLGYRAEEIRHVIMTHLHFDHAGGLADFPQAKIHLYRPEYEHVIHGRAGWAYLPNQWAHGPAWSPHEWAGERWYGFDAIRLAGFEPEIWLVPLTGHTPGHAGVVIRKENGWLWHGGDAVPFNMALEDAPDWLSRLAIGPHVPRIREFMRTHPEVQVISGHMALSFYGSHCDVR